MFSNNKIGEQVGKFVTMSYNIKAYREVVAKFIIKDEKAI